MNPRHAHIPTPEPPQAPEDPKRPQRQRVPGELPPTPRDVPPPIDDPNSPLPTEPVRDPPPDDAPNPKRY